MPHLTGKFVTRVASKLKNTLWGMGEETRLHQCRKAIAEAFDFDSEGTMLRALPCETRWNGEWCANHLADNMLVAAAAAAARLAVESIEAQLGHMLFDRVRPVAQTPLA